MEDKYAEKLIKEIEEDQKKQRENAEKLLEEVNNKLK